MDSKSFVFSDPEKVMSIWTEILVTALYLCVCRICIWALEFYVTTVLARVEVNGREVSYVQNPERYLMKVVILYNGDSVTIERDLYQIPIFVNSVETTCMKEIGYEHSQRTEDL